jgi:hypothetical protein
LFEPRFGISKVYQANYGRAVQSAEPPRSERQMATDYDAPRKSEEDTESIQALQERVPDKLSGVVDAEDADNLGSLELAGQDLANVELDVVVLPPQADEFTCVECFLVKHRSQLDHDTKLGPVCQECSK